MSRKNSGITAKVTSARRQSSTSITAMMPEQREQVAEHRDDARGEQLVDRVHVGRDPRHQPAHGVLVEVADVQPLQVGEDLPPHVQHDALAGQLHDVGLREAHRERRDQREQEQQRHAREAGASPAAMWRSIAILVR